MNKQLDETFLLKLAEAGSELCRTGIEEYNLGYGLNADSELESAFLNSLRYMFDLLINLVNLLFFID